MRRGRQFLLMALLCVLIAPTVGCSAKSSSAAPAEIESADVATDDAAVATSAADDGGERTETCQGVLDCTFFGLGAVLAAPFWVLGAVLGLAF